MLIFANHVAVGLVLWPVISTHPDALTDTNGLTVCLPVSQGARLSHRSMITVSWYFLGIINGLTTGVMP